MKADTPEQQQLLDLIAEHLQPDWFKAEGFKTYEWGTTPKGGRPVLWLEDGFSISTLVDGSLAASKKKGTVVNLVSFVDGRLRVHAPHGLGDPDLN